MTGFLRCEVRYLLTFVAGWVVVSATGPRAADPQSTDFNTYLPFWESFLLEFRSGLIPLLVLGGASTVVLVIQWARAAENSSAGRPLSRGRFRAGTAGLLQLPLLPFAGGGDAVTVLMLTHVLFAAVLMPLPNTLAAKPAKPEAGEGGP